MDMHLDRVLLLTDLSRLSFGALDPAVEMVALSGGHLVVLTVLKPGEDETREERHAVARQFVRERLHNVEGGEKIEIVVVEGEDVAAAVVERAQALDAGIIVMATRGGGRRTLGVGSVTESVVRKSPIPVLAVPAREDPEPLVHEEIRSHMWAG